MLRKTQIKNEEGECWVRMSDTSTRSPVLFVSSSPRLQRNDRQQIGLLLVTLLSLISFCRAVQHGEAIFSDTDGDEIPFLRSRRRLLRDGHSEQAAELFELQPDIQTMGPTVFPKPTDFFRRSDAVAENLTMSDFDRITAYLQPLFGTHRPDQDAVLALAAEYSMDNYLVLLESLRRTGFSGDIVLSLSPLDVQKQEIRDYLESDPHIIVYVPELKCYNFEGEVVDSVKGGMRVCNLPNLYGVPSSPTASSPLTPLSDPRSARTVSVTRYEIYWIMARVYEPQQWLLLIDSRDTYFQGNPFANVPRQSPAPSSPVKSGRLYFFGENTDATRIGASTMNRKWLTLAYGGATARALQDRPIVCSGATMGEQVAIDAYLRAMVAESDETKTSIYGADQGFHNYLYYSGKLGNAKAIQSIVVFAQGDGMVNNLGAMRTKDLSEWGNGKILGEIDNVDRAGEKTVQVLNWDGSPSPVVHQYDRHAILTQHFFKRKKVHFRNAYMARRGAAAVEG